MKHVPWLVLLIALVVGYGYHQQRMGVMQGRIEHLEASQRRTDTVYVTKVKTLTRVRHVTDTLLLSNVTDSVHRDTVRALIAQERLACDAVIQTCEERVAIRDSIIGVLKKKPSVLSHVPWVLGGVVAGFVLTR